MADFLTLIKNVLDEKNMKSEDLIDNNIVSRNTFYKYRQRYPSLHTIINIVNYLQISMDYLFELSDVNDFKAYSSDQSKFYEKLKILIENNKLSNRKFCSDLHFSKDNILRWKRGTEPTVRRVVEIANYFNCSMDDLLEREK